MSLPNTAYAYTRLYGLRGRAALGSSASDSRTGVTLIEVTAAVAITAVLSGMAIVALTNAWRADQITRKLASQHDEAMRLIERLRDDVHHARAVVWSESAAALQLQVDSQTAIRYAVGDGRWERRLVKTSGNVQLAWPMDEGADAETASRTSYRLAPGVSLQENASEAAAGELLKMRIVSGAANMRPADDHVDLPFVAVVGRDVPSSR